jgi:uncharacterized protein YbaR (Trm112 family)/SAM-dependent methyltransferase
MHASLLDILRCPFCGTAFTVVDNDALVRADDQIEEGVLGCECCAFPVIAGIPVLIADDATRRAMHALEAGRPDDALFGLLGLSDETGPSQDSRALVMGDAATYRDALELLCNDAEGTYLLHRFTDPTFVATEALLRAIGQPVWPVEGRVLDLCGGTGHLTRVLAGLGGEDRAVEPSTVLADLSFWKLWLAKRFVAPSSGQVCCDANSPLPFAPGTFSTVVLADAFPYIWHKRLLAEEMMRLGGENSVVVMPHLHSVLGDNFSAGDTLTPAAYHALFETCQPRLFSDERLLNDVLDHRVVDLTSDASPEELGTEPSLTLVASSRADLFRRYDVPAEHRVTGELSVNPMYRVERSGGTSILTLNFPTPEYEAEFGECRRYMPDRITVEADLTPPISRDLFGAQYEELRDRRVLIDAPLEYN